MKKFFDRYLFSKMGLQILFSVILILLFSWLVTVVKSAVVGSGEEGALTQALWGFRQFVDSGVIVETIDNLDEIGKKSAFGVPVMMIVALLAWLMGIVLCGFVTGAIVNAFDGRREKIATGKTRYKFFGHGVVVGWDYQGVGAVRGLFEYHKAKEVIILTTTDVDQVQTELSEAFSAKEQKNIYVYNGVVGDEDQLKELCPQQAKAIVILGDDNADNNDGSNLCIANMINTQVASAEVCQWFDFWVYVYVKDQKHSKLWKRIFPKYDVTKGALFKDPSTFSMGMKLLYYWWKMKGAYLIKFNYIQSDPIICYVDISNDYSIDQLEAIMPSGKMAGRTFVKFKGFNFCREAVSALLENKVELAFRRNPEAKSVHVLISGFNEMARAIIKKLRSYIPVNISCKVTVFAKDVADELDKFLSVYSDLGIEVQLREEDICAKGVRDELISIVRDISSSVNIFLVGDAPDGVIEVLCRLPNEIARENVRIFSEQRTFRKWSPLIKRKGFSMVKKFGLLDEYQQYLMSNVEKVKVSAGECQEFKSIKESFKGIIGVCNGIESDGEWREKGNTIYHGLVRMASDINIIEYLIDKWHKTESKYGEAGRSVAFLLMLESFDSFEVARRAQECSVPYIIVVPKQLDKAIDAIEDDEKRNEYERIIRCAYSYVVDDNPTKYILKNSNVMIVVEDEVEKLKVELTACDNNNVNKILTFSKRLVNNASSSSVAFIVNNVKEIVL